MSFRTLSLAIFLAIATPMTATAQQVSPAISAAAQGTTLTVSATGEASRTPDFAAVSAGVVTQATAVDAAMRENAARMSEVLAALHSAGIAERDIQTSRVSLAPQYRYEQNQAPAIVGYQANNSVSVKVRDLSRLGRVLDALIAPGANQINGPDFGIEHPETAYAEARRDAVRKALAQAQTYADALGVKVRRIVRINEGGASANLPMPRMRTMAAPVAEVATPIASGETTLNVQIEVEFELGG